MRIIAIILLMFGTVCSASAQSDTSYQLLWYKGKKLKTNILLTPGGDSVIYSPQKATVKVVSKSGNGRQLDKMLTELNRNNKRISETVQMISASLPNKKLLPFYSIQVKKGYDQIKSEFTEPLANSISIPAITIPGLQAGTGKGGGTIDFEDIEKIFDDYVAELKAYIFQHKDEVISWVPTPPRYDYSYCYPCDEEKQKQYERDFEAFRKELAGKDYEILEKALSASRQANFLLSEQKNKQIQQELLKLIDFIWVRMEKKASLLLEKYLDDPFRIHAILQIALSTDRVNQLMEPEGTQGLGIDYLERGAMTVARYFEKAVEEKDYSVGLNLSGIFGVDRMLQLIGSSAPQEIMQKVLRFNQFKLNAHVSAKVGNGNGYALAESNGDNWFYALPDTSCRLFWFLVGPYMNKMKIDLLQAEWRGDGGEIPYIGTKNWNTDIPSFRIDFCDDKPDSLTFYPFYPEGFKEMWQFPNPWGPKDVSTISGVYTVCFLNVERTKEDYSKFKDPANVEKMKKEMVAKYQQMLKNNRSNTIARGPDGENYDLTRLSQWADMQKSSRQFSELAHSTEVGRIIFTPEVHNRTDLIIQDKINGKNLFPENSAIEYAWYHIKLEHDPNGPYRVDWMWSPRK